MSEGTSFDWSALYTRAKSVSFDPIPVGPYHVVVLRQRLHLPLTTIR